MNNLLINDNPLVILPKLATVIGLNEAIVLQQIHYWVIINTKKGQNFHDGYYWTYNTYEDWQENFPFWSTRTVRRIIRKLEDMEVVISGNYNKLKIDNTKWYRIDFDKLDEITASCTHGQTDHIERCPSWPDAVDEPATPLPETSSETSFDKQMGIEKKEINKQRISIDNTEGVVNLSPLEFYNLYCKQYKEWYKKDMELNPRAKESILDGQIKEIVNNIPRAQWEPAIKWHFIVIPETNDGNILAFLKAAPRYFDGLADIWLENGWWPRRGG